MAEHLRRLERAFFERLVLVRSGGDSIRRSIAASSFYAAVEAVRTKKKRRLESKRREESAFARRKPTAPWRFFLFCRRTDHGEYKNRADNLRGFTSAFSALRLSVWLFNN